jgi:hypothetical protein
MAARNGNGWNQYQRLVLSEIDSLKSGHKVLDAKLTTLDTKLDAKLDTLDAKLDTMVVSVAVGNTKTNFMAAGIASVVSALVAWFTRSGR